MSLAHSSQTVLLVLAERTRQEELRIERKWGSLADEDYHVLQTVTSEETGEMARALLEFNRAKTREEAKSRLEHLRDEAIQVAAMGAQIAEKAAYELEHWNDPKQAKA